MVLKKLAADIEKRYHLSVKPACIRKTFFRLRKQFTEEQSKKLKQETHKNDDFTIDSELWCIKKLAFLQERPLFLRQAYSPGMKITEKLLAIAEIYQQHPSMWDLNDDANHKKAHKEAAANKLLQQIQDELGIEMSMSELRVNIKQIRKLYADEKHKRVQCEINNTEFKPTSTEVYNQLQFLDEFIAPFRCDQCEEIMKTYSKFRSHVAAHEGRKAFSCKTCGREFEKFSNLFIHMRRHTGETPHRCTVCGHGCVSNSELSKHMRTHTGAKPYVCHLCGKSYHTGSLLNRHIKHHNPESFRFQCTYCPKKFCEKEILKEHIDRHLKIRKHVCGVCGKDYFARKNLRQHELRHSDQKNYVCDICGKKFLELSVMSQHKRAHRRKIKLMNKCKKKNIED